MNEFDFIAKYLKPLAGKEALALSDDAAIIPASTETEYVITADALVEGVHFLPNTNPADLAYKIMGVNLSDLAAMGAEPKFYLCTATLNASVDEKWLAAFTGALKEIQNKYDVVLIGGDTTKHEGALMFSITIIGEVPKGKALFRSGAKVGDDVWVSGVIGEASDFTNQRYLRPEPRVDLGIKLRGLANAVIDVSDGLVADSGHIASASGVKMILQAETIPLAKNVPLEKAITAGDDYELVYTTAPGTVVPGTKIGRVEAGEGVVVLDAKGQPIELNKEGYTHF